jgi:hypothetical protein
MSVIVSVVSIVPIAALTGCQAIQPNLGDRMAAHAANVDLSGLYPDFNLPELNVRAAIPRGWQPMAIDTSPLYVHEQWRSLRHNTGVGVAYIHMPLPMSAKAVVWFARQEYSKQATTEHSPDASLLGEWTDALGREWFEGENEKYHVRGYVVTSSMDAWVVYSGYRLKTPPSKKDFNLALRSMESIVPLPLTVEVAQR